MYLDQLDYYSSHGFFSDLVNYADIFNQFSSKVSEICDMTFNIMINDFLVNMKIYSLPEESKNDVNLRDVGNILDVIVKRNQEAKDDISLFENKLLGNCRDLSLLICAILRHKKIPSRIRSGFATYFSPKKKYDHWLCEYWNADEKRWRLIDPWMYQINKEIGNLPKRFSTGMKKLNLNALDVEPHFFISGADAWLRCYNKKENPQDYGTNEKKLKGDWFIRDNMIRDLFCLNKLEPLPWDCWGIMGTRNKRIDEIESEILVKTANIIVSCNSKTENYLNEVNNYHEEVFLEDFTYKRI